MATTEAQQVNLDLSDAMIFARHGDVDKCSPDRNDRGLADDEKNRASIVGVALSQLGVDLSNVRSSPLIRAEETVLAQKSKQAIALTDNRLSEVPYSRPAIIAQLFIGRVPKAHQESGRSVLRAVMANEMNGYSVTHNGVIAGMRKVIDEFPELNLASYTITKDGDVARERPRSKLRRSLIMKNLAFIAISRV